MKISDRDKAICYELIWPLNLSSDCVEAWLKAVSGGHAKGMRFMIRSNATGIKHYLVLSKKAQLPLQFLHTFLPQIETVKTKYAQNILRTYHLSLSNNHYPLISDSPEIISGAILASLLRLRAGELVEMHISLGTRKYPINISNRTKMFRSSSWIKTVGEALIYAPDRLNTEQRKAFNSKHGTTNWTASLEIGIRANDKEREDEILHGIINALKTMEAPNVKFRYSPAKPEIFSRLSVKYPFVLNANELTGLLGWPIGDNILPGISRVRSRRLPAPSGLSKEGRVIAMGNDPNNPRLLKLSTQDALMHTHILGPTGVGKSTLLLKLICQDIDNSCGVLVIDPKGDLVNEVLLRIPTNRRKDVVVLDPSDTSSPVGLNPLSRHPNSSSLVADDILSIFRGLYGDYFGPRTEDILHAGLLTLMLAPKMNLCALPILYSNPAFRYRLVSAINDPLGLGSFWSWFETISESERRAALSPLMNKLRPFLLRPAMRRVIGQSNPKFNIEDCFSKNKIVLVNLAKGILGSETSRLFGSLILSQVWRVIQSRAKLPPEKRQPCFVYVDEVQSYLNLPTDIGDVLTQSRSYGVGMILAHQHLDQLPSDLKAGVLANARSKICFQLGQTDARTMARVGSGLTPADFEQLSRYHIYTKLVSKGEVLPWASGYTLSPPNVISNPIKLRENSRKQYGLEAAEVEKQLGALIVGNIADLSLSTIGHRRVGATP